MHSDGGVDDGIVIPPSFVCANGCKTPTITIENQHFRYIIATSGRPLEVQHNLTVGEIAQGVEIDGCSGDVLDARGWILDTGYWMLEAGY